MREVLKSCEHFNDYCLHLHFKWLKINVLLKKKQGKKCNLKVYVTYGIHINIMPLVSYNLKQRLQPP